MGWFVLSWHGKCYVGYYIGIIMEEQEYEKLRKERDDLVGLLDRTKGSLRNRILKQISEIRQEISNAHRERHNNEQS